MTVSSSTNRNDYAGNGSTTSFAVSFRFLQNSDIKATLRDVSGGETLQVETTNYTLTGAGDAGGGTLVMLVPPPSGETLTILRDVPATQETDYVENDEFPAESHEDALDKLTMLVQQQGEDSTRHMGFSDTVSDATGAAVELSQDATQRADKLLGFDSAGNIVTKTASDEGLVDQAAQDKRYSPTVATVAALVAANPVGLDGNIVVPVIGLVIGVADYATGNDSGLLIGSVVADATGTADGGTYIDLANGLQWRQNFQKQVDVRQYGAATSLADNYTEFQAAVDANVNVVFYGGYSFEQGVILPDHHNLKSGGVSNYAAFDITITNHKNYMVKTNGDTNSDFLLKKGKGCSIEGFGVFGNQSEYATPIDGTQWLGRAGTYPADTTNPSFGIIYTDDACNTTRIICMNFKETGFQSEAGNTAAVSRFEGCNVTACQYGQRGTFNDSTWIGNYFNQNAEGGCVVSAASSTFVGNRYEWNAVYGLRNFSSGSTVMGNLFDRNGGPGWSNPSVFGAAVTNNFFKRNGVGGDGTNGRYDSTVGDIGHFAYRATGDDDSCHVQLSDSQVMTVNNNRFQSGLSDSGGGADGPKYTLSLLGTSANNQLGPNVGDGFATAYPGGGAYTNDTTKLDDLLFEAGINVKGISTLTGKVSAGADVDITGVLKFDDLASIEGQQFTVADDAVHIINRSPVRYIYEILTTDATGNAAVGIAGFDSATFLLSSGLFVYGGDNTVLTGTTGVDGNLTISRDDNNLYIENRAGASRTFSIFFKS